MAGSYTVEATTYDEGQEDSFTLTFAGLGAAAVSPGPPAAGACVVALGPVTGEVRQSGQWTGDCDSTNRDGSYARFYTLQPFAAASAGDLNRPYVGERHLPVPAGGCGHGRCSDRG